MTEAEALATIERVLAVINVAMKKKQITSSAQVSALVTTGLVAIVAELLHPKDETKQTAFVKQAEDLFGKFAT